MEQCKRSSRPRSSRPTADKMLKEKFELPDVDPDFLYNILRPDKATTVCCNYSRALSDKANFPNLTAQSIPDIVPKECQGWDILYYGCNLIKTNLDHSPKMKVDPYFRGFDCCGLGFLGELYGGCLFTSLTIDEYRKIIIDGWHSPQDDQQILFFSRIALRQEI